MDNKKLRSILVISVFTVILGGFFVYRLLDDPPTILRSERRVAAGLPALSLESVASGEFMKKFENYAADNFPLREDFRTIRSATVFGAFLQTDKDGLYMDSYGAGEFRPIDPGSVVDLTEKLQKVAVDLGDVNVYYAFIPGKSVYSDKYMPGFDPSLAEKLMTEAPGMDAYTFVALTDVLNAESFYRTDMHWRQPELQGVVNALGSAMGFDADLSGYTQEYAGEFEGVYSGQMALPVGADSLFFLFNPSLSATYLDERSMELTPGPVYNLDRFGGLDPYDFFLSGAQPVVILENADADRDKELYLFRDSFSSSLAPLLATGYSRVVLIDLRYIDMRTLGRYVDFKPGSDALFLYSTLVLNNPDMLLVY